MKIWRKEKEFINLRLYQLQSGIMKAKQTYRAPLAEEILLRMEYMLQTSPNNGNPGEDFGTENGSW